MAGDFSFIDGLVPTDTSFNALIRDQLVFVCTSSARPSNPTTYTRIYETDTGYEYWYNGSAWVLYYTASNDAAWTSYTPTWTASGTQPTVGNSSITGKYRLVGKTVDLKFDFYLGATATQGTGTWYFSMPSGLSVTAPYGKGVGKAKGFPVIVFCAGYNIYFYGPTSTTDARCSGGAYGTGTPSVWTTGETITGSLTVEVT